VATTTATTTESKWTLDDKALLDSLRKILAAAEALDGAFESASDAADETADATDSLAKSLGAASKSASAFDKASAFAFKANQIKDFAKNALQGASALFEFAKGGAEAGAVAEQFERLGRLAPKLQDLKAATAGVVEETTLEGYARLANKAGLTADQMEGLAQKATVLAAESGRLGDTGEILNELLKGEAESLRNLGVHIDVASKEFEGMSETQKKLAIVQKLAAEGSQAQVDGLNAQQVAMAKAQTSIDDLVSDAQIMFAEFVTGSGAIELLQKVVTGLGSVLDFVAPVLMKVGEGFAFVLSEGGPVGLLFDGISAAVASAIDMLERVAMVLGIDTGKSVKFVARETRKELEDLAKEHRNAASAALEQSRALGILANTMGAKALDFDQIQTIVQLSESATGADTLAQSMLAAGGTFEGAKDKLVELEDALIRQKDEGELVGREYDRVEVLINETVGALDRMKKATKGATRSIKGQNDALKETASLAGVVGAFGEVVSDKLFDPTDAWALRNPGGMLARFLGTDKPSANDITAMADGFADLGIRISQSIYEPSDAWAASNPGGIIGSLLSGLQGEEGDPFQAFTDGAASFRDTFAEAASGLQEFDEVAALVAADIGVLTDAIIEITEAQKEGAKAGQLAAIGLAAAKQVTLGFIENTRARAIVSAAFEVAEGIASFANPPAAAAHFAAATAYGIAAAKAGGSASVGVGSSGGAAGSRRQVTNELDRRDLSNRAGGNVTIVNRGFGRSNDEDAQQLDQLTDRLSQLAA
jgi:hypothetical protein